MIRYPNIIGKSEAQQLEQIKSYLHQLADELNFRLEQNAVASAASATVMAGASSKPTKTEEAISNFNEIKGLIIKSADIVDSYSEQISKTLKGEYVAVSDFGTYTQDTLAELEISADAIKNTITKVESIDDDIKNEVQSEVKQTAESISLSVDNGETTAQIVLKVGDRKIPATIDMKGLVTFSNLNDGTTEISGDNIKTGTILAEFIDVTNLIVSRLYALDDNGSGITLDVLGLKRTSADKLNPLIELQHDWVQTGGFREERPYLDLFKTFFDRDVNPGELTGGITDGVHLDADGIEFRTNIGNFSDYPVHSYDHTVDFGISRYGDVTGKLKVDTPTADSHVVNKQYVDDGLAGKAPMSHVDDKDNPHGVTAAQVGAAPAGYGLGLGTGDITQLTTAAQVDAAMEAGWYQYYGSNINGNGTAYGGILVVPSMWSVTQFFFCRQHYGSYMKRIYQSNAWNPWEWINPPMLAGVEYRTTDRINGKAVYKRKTDNGYIEWRLDGETKWNRYSGIIGGIQQAANYYSSGKSANDLGTEDSLALIPCNTTTNPELYAIIKSTYAYVLTVYYATINQRAQIAISYAANPPKMAIRTLYGGTWTPWTEISNGMLYGLDTGAITIASGTSKPYTDSASKFYNVTVQIGSTAYRHTFVVDRNAVNNATNKQIGYYSDAMGNQMNLVVSIKDSTTVTFKPTGCNIVHISGYY